MKKFSILTILLAAFLQLQSQTFGLGFVVGVPRNEFRIATDAEGYGLNLNALFPIDYDGVVSVGANLDYMVYGYNSQDRDLFAEIRANGVLIDEILIPLRITNINSIFGFHGNLRITAPTEGIRPYFEGLFGFRYISTNTRITDRSSDNRWSNEDDNLISRKTNLDA